MLKEQCSEKEFLFLLPRGERWDGANSHQKLAGVLPRFRLAARLPRLQRGKRFFRPLAKNIEWPGRWRFHAAYLQRSGLPLYLFSLCMYR